MLYDRTNPSDQRSDFERAMDECPLGYYLSMPVGQPRAYLPMPAPGDPLAGLPWQVTDNGMHVTPEGTCLERLQRHPRAERVDGPPVTYDNLNDAERREHLGRAAAELARDPSRAARVAQVLAFRDFPEKDIFAVSREGALPAAMQADADATADAAQHEYEPEAGL